MLRAAQMVITEIEPGSPPPVGRFARFPDASFAHMLVPRAAGAWMRDAWSRGRTSVIVVASGEVEFDSDQPMVIRGPRVLVIPPGDAPVRYRSRDAVNEVVYATASSTIVSDLLADAPTAPPPPLTSGAALAPMVAFVQHLCATPLADAEASAAPRSASRHIARSLVRVALAGTEDQRSLFERAQEIIAGEHIDPTVDTASLARRLEVTPRVLQLEFQRQGTTVSRELRRARVATATQLRSLHPRPAAAEIARRSGFGSTATLFRALRTDGVPSA